VTVRAVIVDDSPIARAAIRAMLESEGTVEVVGEAENGYEAVSVVDAARPDVVTMDIDMPGPSGLDVIVWIMEKCPVPILVVTGERLGAGSDVGFQAVQRGAVDFMNKPSMADPVASERLRNRVLALARMPAFVASDSPRDSATSETVMPPSMAIRPQIVAIASGLGGTRSIAALLQRLPRDLPFALAIAQHVPPEFGRAFAKYVGSLADRSVLVVGEKSHRFEPGEILLPEPDRHLICTTRGAVASSDAPPVDGVRPSGDLLLKSIAEAHGSSCIGLVLAGAGRDGSQGLARMRELGATTVVESTRTATPNEMPTAAVAACAGVREVTIELIADFLIASAGSKNRTTAPPGAANL
jgi:two-component system, chemotaxis family, protein-glutamate methylesterase/glutaminase